MLRRFFFHKHLEDDETLVRVVHKHWLLGLRLLFWPTVVFAFVWSLSAYAQTRAMITISAVLSIAIVLWWLRSFFDYYLDAWLITDHGIIDIEWFGWFHRESARVLYSDIQGVSYEIHGVAGTLLRYGTVAVEKISNGEEIELEYVSQPKKVESLILHRMETYLHTKNLKDAKHVQEILSAIVAEHLQREELSGEDDGDDEE